MGCTVGKKVHAVGATDQKRRLPFPLSYYQKCVLKDTWYTLESKKLEFGTNVFVTLLERNPGMIKVFPEFKDMDDFHEMVNWIELKGHPRKIFNALGNSIQSLDDGDIFIKNLEELGARHQTRNLEPEYLTAVGESIMHNLPIHLKEEWTEDVRRAWRDLYNFICKTMKVGLNKKTGELSLIEARVI